MKNLKESNPKGKYVDCRESVKQLGTGTARANNRRSGSYCRRSKTRTDVIHPPKTFKQRADGQLNAR